MEVAAAIEKGSKRAAQGTAALQRVTACAECSKSLQLYDSKHPRHSENGAINEWECDSCANGTELTQQDPLFGCPTFDECNFCVCVKCTGEPVVIGAKIPKPSKPGTSVAIPPISPGRDDAQQTLGGAKDKQAGDFERSDTTQRTV